MTLQYSRLRSKVSWQYITLRRALLSALLLLGGWGVFSSLYQVRQSWHEYDRSRELMAWAQAAGQIMTMAQHLAYERGRTAVVLSAPHPISDFDRAFINERRMLANRSIEALYKRVAHLPDVGHVAFYEQWQSIQQMREWVDRDSVLPKHRRDPELVAHWTEKTTAFLVQAEILARHLIRHYRQTEDANRLNMVGFLSYRLRMSIGAEASLIARHVASKKPMTLNDIHAIHEMRGIQKALWYEIDRTLDYLGNAEMKTIVANLKQRQLPLRAMQDEALEAWHARRPVNIRLDALTAASPPLLDGISSLLTQAVEEANRTAKTRMESSEIVLVTHIALAISVMIVMLLAMSYVLKKVVEPLEAVDEQLRRLHYSDRDNGTLPLNEVDRLRQTAFILQKVFEEKSKLEDELRDLAYYDALTQLPNRRLMEDRLRQKILHAKRHSTMLALLFIDLDNFKPINDDFGHEVGDWLLCAVADRIVSCVRESDTAARYGGDEFVVLLPDLNGARNAKIVAEKILEALSKPFFMPGDRRFDIASSIGIAVYPIHANNEQELMRLGDEAMYVAKTSGGNQIGMAQVANCADEPSP
ncbi:MAG: diguanylate cyclase [Oxalobacter sp.]|nr:MAG: diguanylate cyclase [Oxalobacter sp.]